jgi:hypothetical protein
VPGVGFHRADIHCADRARGGCVVAKVRLDHRAARVGFSLPKIRGVDRLISGGVTY